MDNKVAIITDSMSCLTRELVAQNGIRIVPATLHFAGKVYRDWVDITPSEAYELFLKDPEDFSTSAAIPMDYIEAYREFGKQGKDILCITLSSGLSGMYDVARTARGQVNEELSSISIEVFDSRLSTAAEGFVALTAARAAAEGKNLQEVIKTAEEVRDRANFFALLDTVRYVYRSGRIPKIASQIGALTGIKPILTMSSGVIRFAGAVRNKKRGTDRLLEILRSRVGQDAVHVAVMHAYAPEEANSLMERISSEFNCIELWLTEFSPVMGYVCGTGTVGFAFYKD